MNTKHMLFILFVILAQVLIACGAPATPTAEPTSAPTSAPAPTATPEPADPAEIVQAFWDAVKAEDVEAAMTFVADDASCRGSCYFSGKQSFQSYLQGMISAGLTTEISILTVEGDTVTYTYKIYRNGFVYDENAQGESMQVQNGKIVFWNNLHI